MGSGSGSGIIGLNDMMGGRMSGKDFLALNPQVIKNPPSTTPASKPTASKPTASKPTAPKLSSTPAYTGPTAADLAEQERIRVGRQQRDSLYTQYLDLANQAVDYIKSAINTEKSRAAVLGIDYRTSSDIQTERTNNRFADLWSEEQQSQLDKAISDFGQPSNFNGWPVTRGTSAKAAAKGGQASLVGVSRGRPPAELVRPDYAVTAYGKPLDEDRFLLGA